MKPKEESPDNQIQMNLTDIADCDELSDDPDSNESNFDDNDLLASACQDEITAQLAAAGNSYP